MSFIFKNKIAIDEETYTKAISGARKLVTLPIRLIPPIITKPTIIERKTPFAICCAEISN